MLGADAHTEQRMLGGGDIADREDIRVTGAQRRIDQHATVAHRQPGPFGERGVRRRADRDQNGVRADVRAVAESQAGRRAARGGDRLHRGAEPQVHPVVAVQLGENLGDLPSERGQQRQFGHLHDRDVDAAVSGAGGNLQTDPSATDDRQ